MEMNLQEVREFIEKQSSATKVYLGCDSERLKIDGVWYADYMTVVVVHIDGRHGCKVFGGVARERDYDQKANKPANRLMGEVYRVAELYLQLCDSFGDKEVSVHLDINPSDQYGSNCVYSQAVGYIKGVCGITPKAKPDSPASSFAADRFKQIAAEAAHR